MTAVTGLIRRLMMTTWRLVCVSRAAEMLMSGLGDLITALVEVFIGLFSLLLFMHFNNFCHDFNFLFQVLLVGLKL